MSNRPGQHPRRVVATFGDANIFVYGGAALISQIADHPNWRNGDYYQGYIPGPTTRRIREYYLEWYEVVCRHCGMPLDSEGCNKCRDNWERALSIDVYGADVAADVWADHTWIDESRAASMSAYLDTDWPALARSKNPVDRARAVLAIRDYFGPAELDDYPVRLTVGELRRARPYIRTVERMAKRGGSY